MLRIKNSVLIDALILTAISAFFLNFSWQKWANPTWDFGREVYLPWRITHGQILYKDLEHLFGAFPPYWNAFLFKAFGPSILILTLFNIFITMMNTALIYRFFYKTCNRLTALMTGMAFLTLFAFHQFRTMRNMYYIAPYSHSYFYALFFGLCSINLLQSWMTKPTTKKLFLLGLCLSLMLLSRLEIFLALTIPLLIGLGAYFLKERKENLPVLKTSGILLAGFLLPLSSFLIYFCQYFSLTESFTFIVGYNPKWGNVAGLYFYKSIAGYILWQKHLISLSIVLAGYLLFFMSLIGLCWGLTLIRKTKGPKSGILLIISSAAYLAYMVHRIASDQLYNIFAGQAVVIILLAVFFIKIAFSSPDDTQRRNALAILVLAGWALLMLIKIPLKATIYNYGLIYGLPGVIGTIAYLTYVIPFKIEKKHHLKWVAQVLICAILIFIYASVSLQSLMWLSLKRTSISQGTNRIWTFDDSISFGAGTHVNNFLKWAEVNIKPNETFVAFPEGALLNFWTQRTITGRHVTFMPAEMATYGEVAMLSSLQNNPPDYIIFTRDDFSIYGSMQIGINYGAGIFDWVNGNYGMVWKTEGRRRLADFGISVYKKRD